MKKLIVAAVFAALLAGNVGAMNEGLEAIRRKNQLIKEKEEAALKFFAELTEKKETSDKKKNN